MGSEHHLHDAMSKLFQKEYMRDLGANAKYLATVDLQRRGLDFLLNRNLIRPNENQNRCDVAIPLSVAPGIKKSRPAIRVPAEMKISAVARFL